MSADVNLLDLFERYVAARDAASRAWRRYADSADPSQADRRYTTAERAEDKAAGIADKLRARLKPIGEPAARPKP